VRRWPWSTHPRAPQPGRDATRLGIGGAWHRVAGMRDTAWKKNESGSREIHPRILVYRDAHKGQWRHDRHRKAQAVDRLPNLERRRRHYRFRQHRRHRVVQRGRAASGDRGGVQAHRGPRAVSCGHRIVEHCGSDQAVEVRRGGRGRRRPGRPYQLFEAYGKRALCPLRGHRPVGEDPVGMGLPVST
jgi:hypothetical protein